MLLHTAHDLRDSYTFWKAPHTALTAWTENISGFETVKF